jgi:hypothetical protein
VDGTGYLGFDAAGLVEEVGEGVTDVSVGDEVFGQGRNMQAEYAVLDSWAAKPAPVDWTVAAAAGVAGETAERGLRLLDVNAGDAVFVDGGAGGVGAIAVQMALARDASVIASASYSNLDYLREIGLPRCATARAWPAGYRTLPAAGPTPYLMLPARPRSMIWSAWCPAVPGGKHRQLHGRSVRSPGDGRRGRQPSRAGCGPRRPAAAPEQASDQGADIPVRTRR